jgi:hypothetical protein
MRRLAICALDLGVRLKLSGDGTLEVLGPFAVSPTAGAGPQTALVSDSMVFAAPIAAPAPTPEPLLPPPQELKLSPPLRGRRLREQCWPLQQTAYELAVSRWTLWRASRSDLPGFPAPIIVSGRRYWKKSDIGKLEDAFMFFEGRCAFDRKRKAASSKPEI